MFALIQSWTFREWLYKHRNTEAIQRIAARLGGVALGNLGDVREIGEGLCEIRIPHNPEHRIYFVRQERTIVLLHCGEDQGSRAHDIEQARRLASEWGASNA